MWMTVFNPVFLLCCLMFLSMTTNGGKYCGKPGSPYNGHYNPLKPQYGISEIVEYSCHVNTHSLVGQSRRRCLSNETWENAIPTCEENLALGKKVERGSGAVVDNRRDTFFNLSKGNFISVDLEREFDISYLTLTLNPNTTYSLQIDVIGERLPKFQCIVIRNQYLEFKDNKFICNNGKPLRGQHVVVTDQSPSANPSYPIYEIGVFSGTGESKCGDPDVPSHGNVNRYGDEIRYVCDDNYVLVGRTSSWCIQANWNPTGQYCVHQPEGWMGCGEPGTPNNGYRYIGGKLQNESTYVCNKGAALAGHPLRTCLPNGTWSPQQIPKCVTNSALKKTGEPILLDTVKITVKPTSTISVTVFITNDTTTVTHMEFRNASLHMKHFCKMDNVSLATQLECNHRVMASLVVIYLNDTANVCDVAVYNSNEITTCGQPDQPLHGRIKFQNSTSTTYECDHGWTLSGSSVTYCVDGTWDPKPPQCTTDKSTSKPTWGFAMGIMGIALGTTSALLVSFILYYCIRKYFKNQNRVNQLQRPEGAVPCHANVDGPGHIPRIEQDADRIRYPDVNILYDDISGQLIDLNEDDHYLELLNHPHYDYVITHGQVEASNDNTTRIPPAASANTYEYITASHEEARNSQGCQTTNYTNEL